MQFFTQFITLVLSLGFMFLILNTPLSDYMAGILGVVITLGIIYFFIKRRIHKDQEVFTGTNIEVFTIIIVILLTIFLTDGLNSAIFFLVYFLIFGIAFLFEPIMVFVFLAGIIALFVQQYFERNLLSYWLPFVMLISATPISFFFGREFKRREELDAQIQETTTTIIKEAKQIKKDLPEKNDSATEHLNKIIEESSELQKKTE